MEAFGQFADRSYYVQQQKEAELSKSVIILTEQFGLDNDEVQAEVTDIKHYIDCLLQPAAAVGPCNFVDILVSPKTASMFPNIAKLATIYRTLPPHTADCERAFSRMKLVKTGIRNRLGEDSLDCLMRISLNGPPVMRFHILRQ